MTFNKSEILDNVFHQLNNMSDTDKRTSLEKVIRRLKEVGIYNPTDKIQGNFEIDRLLSLNSRYISSICFKCFNFYKCYPLLKVHFKNTSN